MSLTNVQKRELKSRAQSLEPILKIGHAGVSEAFLRSLGTELDRHRLVKVKFTDFKEEKKILAVQIAEKTGAELVMRVGNVAVYYREATGDSAGSDEKAS